jgi:hypothetical protein
MGLHWDGPDEDSNRTPAEARFIRRVAIVTVVLVVALMVWLGRHPGPADPDWCQPQQPYSAEQC